MKKFLGLLVLGGILVAQGQPASVEGVAASGPTDNGRLDLQTLVRGCESIPTTRAASVEGNCLPGAIAYREAGSIDGLYTGVVYYTQPGDATAPYTEINLNNEIVHRASGKATVYGTLDFIRNFAYGIREGWAISNGVEAPVTGSKPVLPQ